MYCPNCGFKSSPDQKFCRSCGLSLEKSAQSLAEQLPTRLDESLEERKNRLERLGVGALSVFGLGVLGFILYNVFYKLMITQGKIMAGLGLLAFVVIIGCGLLSVILFAKAKEVEEARAKRPLPQPAELEQSEATKRLLPDADLNPLQSVTEHTTELLFAEKRVNNKEV